MGMKASAAIAAAAAAFCCAAAAPEAGFKSPSKENHPETWFHFIGGNVARPGITADLEAIKGAGISGVQLFHGQFGGPWPGVSPQITCLSKPWDGLVGFVADECKRLGLRFTMQNCPGWAMSGGPWIKPDNAMRHLVWKRVDAEGGSRIELTLPEIAPAAPNPKDYRDVAVLAFPAPAGDWNNRLRPSGVTSDLPGLREAWAQNKAVPASPHSVTRITFDFAEPVTVRTMELPPVDSFGHGLCYEPGVTVKCEAEGRTLVERDVPAANWQDDRPVTFALDETVTRRLVVTLRNKDAVKLRPIRFFSSARNDDWEAQAGWTLRRLMRNPPARQGEEAWVKSSQVTNVTACMKPDGKFSWDAPAGRWAIVRVGHVNTLRRNAPAPKEGTGFECDKLSPRGAEVQFANYIGRLTGEGGPAKGKMANMLMDSWECKRQTWTPGLDRTFRERMGYDLFTWMPAIFGYVVDGPEASARFLNDWRGFIGDQITDNFFARMARLCHERGMTISFETAFGDVLPGDIMKYCKYADTPMCEFWQPRERGYVGSHNFKPVRPTVSAAHVYGKRSVAAEALTSFQLTWDEKLRDLKYVANIHMAMGVSHLVFHTYTHNPRTDWLPPGTSFGAHIGTPFLRGQTWWKFMPSFTEYLARCQTMLEAGLPVSDVLWYLGDEWDHKPDEDAPFPAGYQYDYCNPDALLTRFSVGADGMWRTLDGVAYRILWMPACQRLAPETLERVRAGVEKGGVVAMAALPSACSTLVGGKSAEARFLSLRNTLAEISVRGGKSGRLYVGRPLEDVLKAEKVAADVECDGLLWNHRRSEGDDWYFVTPTHQNIGFRGAVGFRAEGAVEIWSPETGRCVNAPIVDAKNGRTRVALSLAPHESCFVVFRRGVERAAVSGVAKDGKTVLVADGTSGGIVHSAVKVIEARYGDLAAAGRWKDVSGLLQAALDAGKTAVTVNNLWAGGDPAFHTVKNFSARLRMPDGSEKALSCREGGAVALPCKEVADSSCDIVEGRIVAFENGAYAAGGKSVKVGDAAKIHVAGPWRVKFPEGWGMPAETIVAALKPWKEIGPTPEAKAFSGTATYETEFNVGTLGFGAAVVLDLGRVESLAQVEVNGRKFPDLWSFPYRLDVTEAVRPGTNRLKVSVTDTWFNRLAYDAGQPEDKRRTWTIRGPRKDSALRDSGLIGPVRILRGRAVNAAEPIELAVRGKAPSLAIVLPEHPGATEKYAAEELQKFLEKTTGARLEIVSRKAGAPAPAKGVFIEKISSGLGDDGFRLKAENGNLRIIGGKRGVLYGVYEVLEKYAGCRWYASWYSVIPQKDRVAVPGDLDDSQKPAFLMRESYWYDVNNNRDFAARLRVNGYNHTTGTVDAKYGGDDFRFGGGLGSCHTFEALLSQGVYFDKHPEYYSLVKGKRLRGRTQLCLTNPDVLRIVTSNVLERIRKDPGAKFYGVSQNDWYNFCECEKCAAVDKEEESHAGTMVRFVNAIAEAVEKEFPNAVIETLAYQYTRKPPKKTRLRRNVMPCLCTIECDFTRPIPENPYGENVKFMSDINGWKTQTDQLYLWDYTTEFQDFALPFPNVYALQGNIKFFRENNVKELFEQGDQCGRHGAFAELKAWLLAKFMWDPDQPIEPLLDDFFAGYYGKAAPFVREYFEEVHRRMRAWSPSKGPMRIWRSEAFRGLGGDFVEWAKPVWDKAEAAVKGDWAVSYNVRMTKFSFDFLRLEKLRGKAYRLFSFVTGGPVDDGARLRQTQALAKSMLDRMDEAKDISLSESRHRHNAILAAWRGLVARKPVAYVSDKIGKVEDKYMTLHKEGTWGARVDDPLAEDGKALKLFNSHFEWCVGFSAGCVEFKPGVKYNVRARIRVEKARDGGEAFWAGVYNPVDKHLSRMIQPRTEAVKDGGYVWYDVAAWTPRADGAEYFWLGPGRFGPDGKSSIKAVYLDKIEIAPVE